MRKLNLGKSNRKNVFLQIDVELVRKASVKSSQEGIKSFRELIEKLLKEYVGETL